MAALLLTIGFALLSTAFGDAPSVDGYKDDGTRCTDPRFPHSIDWMYFVRPREKQLRTMIKDHFMGCELFKCAADFDRAPDCLKFFDEDEGAYIEKGWRVKSKCRASVGPSHCVATGCYTKDQSYCFDTPVSYVLTKVNPLIDPGLIACDYGTRPLKVEEATEKDKAKYQCVPDPSIPDPEFPHPSLLEDSDRAVAWNLAIACFWASAAVVTAIAGMVALWQRRQRKVEPFEQLLG